MQEADLHNAAAITSNEGGGLIHHFLQTHPGLQQVPGCIAHMLHHLLQVHLLPTTAAEVQCTACFARHNAIMQMCCTDQAASDTLHVQQSFLDYVIVRQQTRDCCK